MALTRKPRVGDVVSWPGGKYGRGPGVERGRVTSIDAELCWVLKDGCEKPQPFIWQFKEGLNAHHTIEELK